MTMRGWMQSGATSTHPWQCCGLAMRWALAKSRSISLSWTLRRISACGSKPHAPRENHCAYRPARWLFLKPMHPGGSLDHNYYSPMPATRMAACIVTICAIYQKMNLLVTLCCKTTQPLAHYPRPFRHPWGLGQVSWLSLPGKWVRSTAHPYSQSMKFCGQGE